MPVDRVEVLKANIVLVGSRFFLDPGQIEALGESIDAEIIEADPVPGLSLNISTPGTPSSFDLAPKSLTIGKDRITIMLLPDRTSIEMEYPTTLGINRLAYVSSRAIALNSKEMSNLRAFGFNIEASYRLASGRHARKFIANNFLASEVFEQHGFELEGGAVKLNLRREHKEWNINIEPRAGTGVGDANKVFANVNLHFPNNDPALRSQPQPFLTKELDELWKQCNALMEGLN